MAYDDCTWPLVLEQVQRFRCRTICDLGSQVFWRSGQLDKPAGAMFREAGLDYIAIDITGEHHALPLDLRKPVDVPNVGGPFDLVADMGTLEHVGDQYAAWKNAHDLCEAPGVMVHALPMVGGWTGHCRYRYDAAWFRRLHAANQYAMDTPIIIPHERGPMIFAVVVKLKLTPFCSRDNFPAPYESDESITDPETWNACL